VPRRIQQEPNELIRKFTNSKCFAFVGLQVLRRCTVDDKFFVVEYNRNLAAIKFRIHLQMPLEIGSVS